MKSTLFQISVVLIAILLALFLSRIFWHSPIKIAYVEVGIIMEKATPMKILKGEIESIKKSDNSKIDSLVAQFEKEIKSFEKERNSLSKKEVSLKEEILRGKQEKILKFQEWTTKNMNEEEKKRTQTIYNELNDLIMEYAKKHSYDIILGANGTSNILYGNDKINITEDILLLINNDYESRQKADRTE